jgi:hypothetical protein
VSVTQNLTYSVIQVVHNAGAVAAVGGSFAAIKLRAVETRQRLAWLTLAGWGAQAASGAVFGAVSYYFYHQFPDISGVAEIALGIKMACAAAGFTLMVAYLFFSSGWSLPNMNRTWVATHALAATALTAAAVLRWFA